MSISFIIIQTGSRGAFIALLFALILYFFSPKINLNKLIAVIITIIIALFFMIFYQSLKNLINDISVKNAKIADSLSSFEALRDYISQNNESKYNSIEIRKELIKNGLKAFYMSKGIGVGGGGSKKIQEEYGSRMTSMHNFWIEILIEGGIYFFIPFVVWYIYVVIKLYIITKKTKYRLVRYYSRSLYIAMSSFGLGCISASSVIYLLPMYLMFGFAISTINNYRYLEKSKKIIIAYNSEEFKT